MGSFPNSCNEQNWTRPNLEMNSRPTTGTTGIQLPEVSLWPPRLCIRRRLEFEANPETQPLYSNVAHGTLTTRLTNITWKG